MKTLQIGKRGTLFEFTPLNKWRLNCYLIEGKNRNYLIDTACGTDDAAKMNDYILKKSPSKPLIIINTHFHWDHVWGNCYFKNRIIISEKLCREYLLKNWETMLAENVAFVSGNTELTPPNTVFTKSRAFDDDDIYLFSSKGHTPDGICVYDGVDKILYVGDNIGDSADEPVPELMCGADEYENALREMLAFPFVALASGHNEIMNRDFINVILAKLKHNG